LPRALHFEKVRNADLFALFCHILLSSPEERPMYTLRLFVAKPSSTSHA
jgi:hypothetical protein